MPESLQTPSDKMIRRILAVAALVVSGLGGLAVWTRHLPPQPEHFDSPLLEGVENTSLGTLVAKGLLEPVTVENYLYNTRLVDLMDGKPPPEDHAELLAKIEKQVKRYHDYMRGIDRYQTMEDAINTPAELTGMQFRMKNPSIKWQGDVAAMETFHERIFLMIAKAVEKGVKFTPGGITHAAGFSTLEKQELEMRTSMVRQDLERDRENIQTAMMLADKSVRITFSTTLLQQIMKNETAVDNALRLFGEEIGTELGMVQITDSQGARQDIIVYPHNLKPLFRRLHAQPHTKTQAEGGPAVERGRER